MKLWENCQSGRSMVEIIGVLAIIGVLSVGGIAAYTKAMEKINIDKSLTQFSEIIRNITKFSSKQGFGELDTKDAIQMGLVPEAMVINENQIGTLSGNEVIIRSVDKQKTLVVLYNKLKQAECLALASADWGSASAGLKFMVVSPTGLIPPRGSPSNLDEGEYSSENLPLSITEAAKHCNCHVEFGCGIAWFFR